MAAIDDAIKSYQGSLDDATKQFISDTQELEDEELSLEEILAILAALSFAEYFVEELGLSTGINAYMAATETVLADLPFFGVATETQLVALQNIQRYNIESLTRYVSSTMRSSMAQGILNRLDKFEMEDLIRANIKSTVPRLDNVIVTQISNYQQAVVSQMASDLPASTKYRYDGPRDDKNRAVCREYLNAQPLTRKEIKVIKSDGFMLRGGVNCRHLWFPVDV
jgi:hypothetical protein|tara:strand:+ start:661 stop:1332 length:672 start_codon:yes stop_codon:yes gene_type:complete